MTLMIAQEEEQGAFMGTGQNNLIRYLKIMIKFLKVTTIFF